MAEPQEFLDWAQFDDDAESHPIVIKNLLGRDWELPGIGDLPADFTMRQSAVILRAARLAKHRKVDLTKGESLPREDMMALAEMMSDEEMNEALLGKDNLDEMRKLGITERQLRKLVQYVQRIHNPRDEDEQVDEDEDGPTSPEASGTR